MRVLNTDTMRFDEWNMFDLNTGVDYVQDFIGNHGGFDNPQLVYNEDEGYYMTDNDTFEWWVTVIADNLALNERIAELQEMHGSEAVADALAMAQETELEYFAQAANQALDEAFAD